MGLKPGQTTPQSFKPGQSGNPNGRPKGAKNTFTLKQKKVLQKILSKFSSVENLEKDLAEMSAKDRVSALSNYLKYFLTTSKQIKNTYQGNVKVQVSYQQKAQQQLEDIQDSDDFEVQDDIDEDEEP